MRNIRYKHIFLVYDDDNVKLHENFVVIVNSFVLNSLECNNNCYVFLLSSKKKIHFHFKNFYYKRVESYANTFIRFIDVCAIYCRTQT